MKAVCRQAERAPATGALARARATSQEDRASQGRISSPLTRALGNTRYGRLLQTQPETATAMRFIQPELKVGPADDVYEREADRVAERVTRMSTPPPKPQEGSDSLAGAAAPPIVKRVLATPGRPLEPAVRSWIEPRLGHELGGVRTHFDSEATASARAVNARAYTVGRHVVFGAGQYSLHTSFGRRLLAHELTHVVQQRAAPGRTPRNISRVSPGGRIQRAPISDETRWRIELCVKPSYYNSKGEYTGSRFEPKPVCSDMKIPSDRERAWKCLDSFYWSRDGKKWSWSLDPRPDCSDVELPISLPDFRTAHATSGGRRPALKPGSTNERKRIKLCVDPFYYDAKGDYTWSIEAEPDCSDLTIPADRARAWECLNPINWGRDGKTWTWRLRPEPDCSDLKLPKPVETYRSETAEEKKAREAAEKRDAIVRRNQARIITVREGAPTDLEALARIFTDKEIVDDGTIEGRVDAIVAATEHALIPGLQTGVAFKQSGFAKEFLDPWPSSINQVGHFLTAVRLGFDPDFANNLIFLAILGAWTDSEIPLRLIIGHEKEPDPGILDIFEGFRAQYRATTDDDIKHFKAGNLEKIKVGTGRGNSMADLKLSHKGWILGRSIAAGRFKSKKEIADWIRRTLGKP